MNTLVEESKIFKVSRRDFIKSTSVGLSGLMLGISFSCTDSKKLLGDPNARFAPNVYISIAGNGLVTLIAHRSEMGTGIRTSLPRIIADELEATWNMVKVEQAEGDEKYGDQNTDGSYSVRMFFVPLRKAGAMARTMLEQAAAKEWNVDVSSCKAKDHEVVHTSGKTLGYGYLAGKASTLPLPDEGTLKLKDPADFKFIGKQFSIVDLEDIVTGKAKFGMDTVVPNTKVAVIQRSPEAGVGVKSFNADAAMKVPGVTKVFKIDPPGFPTAFNKALGGVVVVAENTWSAMKGRKELTVEWEKGNNADYTTSTYIADMMKRAKTKGKVRRDNGNVDKAFSESTKILEAEFIVPTLSHASMETPTAIASVTGSGCEVWAPVQDSQNTRKSVADALGMDVKNVKVNVTLLGGAFGRKSMPDFVVEAALISKEIGSPVKIVWTREDDIQHDFYHSPSAQYMKVGINKDNQVVGWLHRSVFPPIMGTVMSDANEPAGFELSLGMIDMPYVIGNVRCETHVAPTRTRIGWLRSVCNIQHAFAVCGMIDEIAHARGVDPVQNIMDLIGEDRTIDFKTFSEEVANYNEKQEDFPWETARFKKVVTTAKEKSNWGKQLPKGSGQGIAVHRSFLTYVACVVEVTVGDNNKITINKVDYVVDCGIAVNPERVKSQFEGGASFSTSIAMKSEITIKNGATEQSNFHNYLIARMTDAPLETAVHIIESDGKPTGAGEPPVPPFAPALCNAIFAATGKRIRQLPIKLA